MSNETTFTEQITDVFQEAKKYIEIKYKIAKLDATEKIAVISSFLLAFFIIMGLTFAMVFFFSTALAFYLGKIWDSQALGFLCVAGIYAVLVLIIILVKETMIKKPILHAIIKLMFKKIDENEH